MKVAAGGAVGDLARARIALDERGQRLGELEERTALMMSSAETFSKHAHEVKQRKEKNFQSSLRKHYISQNTVIPVVLQLMLKCKDKKWYQF